MLDLKVFSASDELLNVASFLNSASLAHNIPIQKEEWFRWKFGDNSYGESILACALDKDQVVGCVAIGRHDFSLAGRSVRAGLSYETFVHPDYQGRQIFSRLIEVVESEARHRGISFLVNFPNANSLRGFVKIGWTQIDLMQYWMRFDRPFHVLGKVDDVRKPFIADGSNFDELRSISFHRSDNYASREAFYQLFSDDYLEWRFKKHPVGHYVVFRLPGITAVARSGSRGRLKELQFLYLSSPDPKLFSKVVRECRKEVPYDLISFPASGGNAFCKYLPYKFFLKVPSKANFCYKILDPDFSADFSNLSFPAASAHTY